MLSFEFLVEEIASQCCFCQISPIRLCLRLRSGQALSPSAPLEMTGIEIAAPVVSWSPAPNDASLLFRAGQV